ncbi:MAG TPA: hypothetical protein PLO78_10135, partial [Candidatus Omnitrophota bacterium]|nr:hypothetical protein [Candidatus Omnitrophota bacterium]
MQALKEKYKIGVLAGLLLVASVSIYIFYFVVKTEIIFTPLLYMPVILAAMWWQRKVFWVVLVLVAQLLAVHFFAERNVVAVMNDSIRSVMLVVVASMISFLSEQVKREKDLLEKANIESEKKIIERTEELSEMNARLSLDILER